jgi:5-methylcytosine-specific restriction endonuclease McrA
MKVPVLDTNRKILAPTTPRRARLLLKNGKAAVFKKFPFTIILKREVEEIKLPELQLKFDPGSKVTGIAIVNQKDGEVVFAAELEHRGWLIKERLDSRRLARKFRRYRKTRYRPARFLNRASSRRKGRIMPSLMSRVYNIETWTNRLIKTFPISGISVESVKFDTQKMQNPEISGIEYQYNTKEGCEIREYLLEKFKRTCVYCGKQDIKFEVEHVIPKSRNGSDRVSNLVIACNSCNSKKDNLTAEEFGFPEVQAQCKKSLKDAAVVNITRKVVVSTLESFGLPVELGTGGMTKFNRIQRNLPKEHWVDAACVGESTPKTLKIDSLKVLKIKAMGHGNRQMCRTDKFGFPIAHKTHNKTFLGYKTGDFVKAIIPRGKHKGIHIGRVTIRQRRDFTLNGFDVNSKYLQRIYRVDGFMFNYSN